MTALIGDLIVKACLAIGVLVLGIGAGVATYSGIYLAKDKLQSNPPSVLKSEFKESWVTPTPILSPKPAIKGKYNIPTPDPDPITTCNIHANCGGGSRQMKKSECNQTICCQIEGKWYFYLSKEKCLQNQREWADYHKRNYYAPSYNFPAYTYTPAPIPTYQPLPTPTPDYSYLVEELEKEYQEEYQRKCQKIVDDWMAFKTNWHANEYNNYSSSGEAIMDLSRYKASTEERLRNEGCSNPISLYEGRP